MRRNGEAATLQTTELESLNVFLDFLRLVDIACREVLYRALLFHCARTGNPNQIGNDLRVFALCRYRIAKRPQYQEQENNVCNARGANVTTVLMIE